MRPELSRPVTLGHVPPGGRDLVIEASPAECAALAKRLGIEEVRQLKASLHLAPEADGAVRATGRLEWRIPRARRWARMAEGAWNLCRPPVRL